MNSKRKRFPNGQHTKISRYAFKSIKVKYTIFEYSLDAPQKRARRLRFCTKHTVCCYILGCCTRTAFPAWLSRLSTVLSKINLPVPSGWLLGPLLQMAPGRLGWVFAMARRKGTLPSIPARMDIIRGCVQLHRIRGVWWRSRSRPSSVLQSHRIWSHEFSNSL